MAAFCRGVNPSMCLLHTSFSDSCMGIYALLILKSMWLKVLLNIKRFTQSTPFGSLLGRAKGFFRLKDTFFSVIKNELYYRNYILVGEFIYDRVSLVIPAVPVHMHIL